MALIKDLSDCSTYSVRGLDDQLVHQMNQIKPALLANISDLNVQLGKAVHPWLQRRAYESLKKAIAYRKQRMIINSAYRTIAGQALLRSHFDHKRCGIVAASLPGKSNHNNASAIDIEDSAGWRGSLQAFGWKWIGQFDPMHYDHLSAGNITPLSIIAFQQIWNECRPKDKLLTDGEMGVATLSRLRHAPAEGFPDIDPVRILCLTEPVQIGDDVGKLQIALRDRGYDIGKADKIFGMATQVALLQFQKIQS